MYLRLHVDKCEVLEELSDNDLRDELKNRNSSEPIEPDARECNQSLDDAAFALRKAGHINLAWRLDEIRNDYFKVGRT